MAAIPVPSSQKEESNNSNNQQEKKHEQPTKTEPGSINENMNESTPEESGENKTTDTTDTTEQEAKKRKLTHDTNQKHVHDVCTLLGFQGGSTRFEVQWDLTTPADKEENNKDKQDPEKENDDENDQVTTTVWWGATLQPPLSDTPPSYHTFSENDDNDEEEEGTIHVPVRHLLYDPMPDYGYEEATLVECAFLSESSLFDLQTKNACTYRIVSNSSSTTDNTAAESNASSLAVQGEGVTTIIDQVLSTVMAKHHAKFQQVTPYQQCMIAEQMSKAREALLEKMLHGSGSDGVITAQTVMTYMAEVGEELKKNKKKDSQQLQSTFF